MGHAAESLEHAQHIGHGGHGGHGHDGSRLPMAVGITMAILGVLLAYAAAKVGGERTELIQALVDQQHAHAQYQAQDIKHRVAMLSLQNLHAEADVARTNPKDMVMMADAADRYLRESQAANTWVDAYDPLIEAHAGGQEDYEHAQLAAEFGIVIASIALLLRRREPWFLAMALGVVSITLLVMTYVHAHGAAHTAEAKIEDSEHVFEQMRAANKTTAADQALVDDIRKTYGGTAPAVTPR
jgi:hypothetical protein